MKFIVTIVVMLNCIFVWSQSQQGRNIRLQIPELALLDIEPNASTISLSFTAPMEAGSPVVGDSDSSKWLNYTSCIVQGGPSRSVSVNLNRTLPGVDLKLQVSGANGGGGSLGTPLGGTITLSTSQTTILSNIGGAFTGDGSNQGHQLTYSIEASTYSDLEEMTGEAVLITYTISN